MRIIILSLENLLKLYLIFLKLFKHFLFLLTFDSTFRILDLFFQRFHLSFLILLIIIKKLLILLKELQSEINLIKNKSFQCFKTKSKISTYNFVKFNLRKLLF